jgi:hypothetical protein
MIMYVLLVDHSYKHSPVADDVHDYNKITTKIK